MRRRGRGHGNIFGDSEPEQSLPEFDVFIHAPVTRRRLRYRTLRAGFATSRGYSSVRRNVTRPVRPWVLGVRIAVCSIFIAFGLIGMAVEVSHAVSGYSNAGTMASAPTCPAGVDPTTTTADCVGTLNVVAPDGVFDEDGGQSLELDLPPARSDNVVWPDFPGNAQFTAAVGDGSNPTVVRAEFWEGQIVTLTAGKQEVTVTTAANPNNVGGVGLGGALVSLCFVLIGLLMLIGIRAIRLRWLHPGIALTLFVSGSTTLSLGLFVAGVCLINQPERVALVAAIAPSITLGLTGLLWLALWSGHRGRVRLASRIG